MTGRAIGLAAVGAVVGAVIWFILLRATGWNLWILAPVVGGCAGFGMMRGTQMRGGLPAGAVAAAWTLLAIVGVRAAMVSIDLRGGLEVDQSDIIGELAMEVADEWADNDYEVYDEESGDFTPGVYAEAQRRWHALSSLEQQQRIVEWLGRDDASVATLTAGGMLWDFGPFGLICTALAAGTAFKTGSITLEQALVERGYANDGDDVDAMAADLRRNDGGFFARLGHMDAQSSDESRQDAA